MNRPAVARLALLLLALLAPALTVPVVAWAQGVDDPSRLFPREAPIDTGGQEGLVRLPLPAAVLEASRPDLSDVRVHRGDGTEAAYVVESGLPPARTELTLTPTSVQRRIARGASLRRVAVETFELAPPASDEPGVRSTLRFSALRDDFVRRVRVRDPDGALLAEGTIFRLLSPRRERLLLELPPHRHARITVEIEGEGEYLEPVLHLASTRAPIAPVTFTRALEPEAVRHAEGRTTLSVPRPVGLTPDTLRVRAAAGTFAREVRVMDLSANGAPREIGRGTVFRVEELGIESLDLRLEAARGERLRVEIEHGDAGPLDARFEAVVRQPSLLFRAGPGAHHLRFGGGRARPPRYDLRALLTPGVARRLRAVELPTATLGALRDNPAFDDGPALEALMRPGRAPDPAAFTHVATLVVEGAAEGLSHVRIPPAVQALARDDLGALRVLDPGGRQQPYLVSRSELADPVEAEIEVREETRATRYRIVPRSGRARVERVSFEPDAAYVARAYALRGRDGEGEAVLLAEGLLRRDPDDPRPVSLALAPTWVTELELLVQDGDDAPLVLGAVTVDVVSPTLSLAAADGTYRVLVGNPEAEPPVYEIANAPPWLLDVRAGEGAIGAPAANPEHVEPPWHASVDAPSIALWSMLLLALVVLGVLTVRLAKAAPEPNEAPVPGGEAAGPEEEEEQGRESPADGAPPADTRPSRF